MKIQEIADKIIDCFDRGNKTIIFGNGGSLADSSHFASEFHAIGPVIALNDPVKITSIANDYSFELVFAQQIRDIGKKGDLVIGLSSSGKSANVNLALQTAQESKMKIIDFPRVGNNTQEVQNYQYSLLHEIYVIVKEYYAGDKHLPVKS